tara:strand:- start:3895 stop:4173 length:279 start_codon:yes stop_codon:yes gene_type:complete
MESTDEMNSGMYLEAMNQLKEMNDTRDKELRKLERYNLEIKKELISCFGVIRLIDIMYKDSGEPIIEIGILIESLREYLEQYTETKIISKTE